MRRKHRTVSRERVLARACYAPKPPPWFCRFGIVSLARWRHEPRSRTWDSILIARSIKIHVDSAALAHRTYLDSRQKGWGFAAAPKFCLKLRVLVGGASGGKSSIYHGLRVAAWHHQSHGHTDERGHFALARFHIDGKLTILSAHRKRLCYRLWFAAWQECRASSTLTEEFLPARISGNGRRNLDIEHLSMLGNVPNPANSATYGFQGPGLQIAQP